MHCSLSAQTHARWRAWSAIPRRACQRHDTGSSRTAIATSLAPSSVCWCEPLRSIVLPDAVPRRTNGCAALQGVGKQPLGIIYSPSISSSHGERCCRRLGPGLLETLMHPSSKGSIRCLETAQVCGTVTVPSHRLLCLQSGPIDIDVAALHQMKACVV